MGPPGLRVSPAPRASQDQRWLPEVQPHTSHHIYGAASLVLLTILCLPHQQHSYSSGKSSQPQHRLHLQLQQQPWRCPTALLSSSRTILSCLTASPCWTSLMILWPMIQLQTLDTSALEAACLPPLLWTPSASPLPPSRLPETNRTLWTVSSSTARQHLIRPTRHRVCPAPVLPQPPLPQGNPGPGIQERSGRQPVRGRS